MVLRRKNVSVDKVYVVKNFYHLSPGQTIATFQGNMSQHCWAQHVVHVWPPCCDVEILVVIGSNLKTVKFLAQHL